MYFLVVRQKFTANVVVGLLGNESSDSNRFTLVTPKPENGVRLQEILVIFGVHWGITPVTVGNYANII